MSNFGEEMSIWKEFEKIHGRLVIGKRYGRRGTSF